MAAITTQVPFGPGTALVIETSLPQYRVRLFNRAAQTLRQQGLPTQPTIEHILNRTDVVRVPYPEVWTVVVDDPLNPDAPVDAQFLTAPDSYGGGGVGPAIRVLSEEGTTVIPTPPVPPTPPPAVTVVLTMPPVNYELGEATMRDMGRVGSHMSGHYFLLGDTHYVWTDLGDGSFDPATFDSALDGRTGIQVTMTPEIHTAEEHATATADAIDDEGTFGASAAADLVVVSGTDFAQAGGTSYEDAGEVGIRGMQYSADLIGGPYFASDVFRASRLDPADVPTDPFVVTGMRLVMGDQHTAQVPVAVYQGGAGVADFEGATFLGVAGVTSGSDTEAVLYAGAPTPFLVDPAAGQLWIAWMHDTGGVTMPFPLQGDPPGTTSNFINTGANGIIIAGGGAPASSDPADFPASAPAIGGGAFGTYPSIAISFVTEGEFQNNMAPVGLIGTQAAAAAFPNLSDGTLLVGNSYGVETEFPFLGTAVYYAEVNYGVHVLNNDYRVSLATGGAAFDDFSGAAFYDVGIAGPGTVDIDWVRATPGVRVPIPPSTRFRLMLHHLNPAPAARSFLRFDAGAPNIFSPPENPARFYDGNTTESEVDDGSLGGVPPTTNVVFDAALPQVAVPGTVVVPNGFNYTNDNNVGVRAAYVCDGFSVAS